jgi:hypothetical protein
MASCRSHVLTLIPSALAAAFQESFPSTVASAGDVPALRAGAMNLLTYRAGNEHEFLSLASRLSDRPD